MRPTESNTSEIDSISSTSDVSHILSDPHGFVPKCKKNQLADSDQRITRRLSEPSSIKTTDTGRSTIISGISRTVTRTLSTIKKAVDDDNLQADNNTDDLNKLLERNFDIDDALRLTETAKRTDSRYTINTNTNTNANAVNAKGSDRWFDQTSDSESEYRSEVPVELAGDDEGQTLNKVFTNKETNTLDLPPEGGYGWVCCLCVTLVMFSTWGCNSAFGVFLAFYLNNSSFAGASKYDYALIAGMTVFFGQGLPPFVLLFMRIFGLKIPMYFGIVIMCLGFVLASYAVSLWQLYLTQGFLSGVGISFIFAPATTVLPGWFLKKRSFAMGLSLIGTGAGGVAYSLAVNKMIENTGNQRFALRILAITCSITCVVATLLLRQRVPMKATGIRDWKAIKQHCNDMFSMHIFRKWTVQLIAVWFMFALFGYTLMIFTLSSYAVANGLTAHQGSSLTAILNGAQSVGRPLIGYTGDKIGRTNITVMLTLLLTIFMFGFWIPADSYSSLIGFSICVGLCIGVANVMNTVLVADIVGPVDFLPAWGYVNLVGSPFMLVAEVIAQALTEPNSNDPYLHTQIFAGCCFFAALLLILGLREVTVKIKIKERQTINLQRLKDYDSTLSEKDNNTLREREIKYDYLLGSGIKSYFTRMFYPMHV
ncbi:Esbp6 [Kluyveromyces lactis]|nr:Esbp6 [Kluyveromyces lactis]